MAAELISVERIDEGGKAVVRIGVRNIGTATWTPETQIRVGTARPHDRSSYARHASWIGIGRAAMLREHEVVAGAVGRIEFEIDPRMPAGVTIFQLLAEGHLWFPNTEFAV